ncbi:MAG: isopeptide-forming domain-containing fimbrial protein [Peptoniphilus sp.]|nr:isopeptide-forming domain-containing fimbrial protein [Peptoniphilus sp.]MDD7363304.1 isopeptide-forming domain-containing fimbrial protein [Bacillota bacterium]MDY6045266.1 isopeptide-forming domain-containing fimbrial protein [Peptoniphilus sp.]
MKKVKKVLSMLLALVMVLTIVGPSVYAAQPEEKTNSVTLHKILSKEAMENDKFPGTKGLDNTDYVGNKIDNLKGFFGGSTKDIGKVYFAWQNKAGQWIDGSGNVVDSVDKALGGLTVENAGFTFDTSKLPNGEYKIVEVKEKSTYVGENGETLTGMKAVPVEITLPLYNDDGVVENAHVYPKNMENKPQIDKNFATTNDATEVKKDDFDLSTETGEGKNPVVAPNAGAQYENYQKEKARVTAELGKKIPYEVKTQIPQGAAYKKLVWNDVMTKGLTFNNDLVIKLGGTDLEKGTDYNIIADSVGFRLTLTTTGLTAVENAAKDAAAEITLTYSATVNSKAVADNPEKNDIQFDYGNFPGKESEPKEGSPSNQEIKVQKDWAIEGQNEVSDADKNVKVVYVLEEKQADGSWKFVEEHEATLKENFEYTFTNLDDDKTYRVVEHVSGYEPEYVSFENGIVKITNEKNPNNPNPLNPTESEVVNGGKKFVKVNDKDGADQLRLAGAEFYVKDGNGNDAKYLVAKSSAAENAANVDVSDKKTALDAAVKAYNDLTADQQKDDEGKTKKAAIDKAQKEYDDAFKEAAQKYEWVEKTGDTVPAGAVVLVSDGQGQFEITGLAYGDYYLEEKEPPKGFAKRSDLPKFTVAKDSYKGADTELPYYLKNAEGIYGEDTDGYGQKIINRTVTIPETGGMGTILFVIIGIALMAGATIAMKKRNAEA